MSESQKSEAQRILDQLHRAFHGGAWHGPAVLEVLDGVDAETAARKPVGGGHSIWELVRHVAFWEAVVLRRLRRDETPVDQSGDWGEVKDTSVSAWEAEQSRLRAGHGELERELGGLRDERLAEVNPGDNTLYTLLHGALQHDLYHAGQMQLLKRMFEKG